MAKAEISKEHTGQRKSMPVTVDTSFLSSLEVMERDDLVKIIKNMATGGIAVMFHGKRSAMEIQKLVRPRSIRIDKNLSYGSNKEQTKNIILEGENLQGMVTLYKYRNSINLILTDPPYNTGKSFRYNDKWDKDPNDPDLGNVVPLEDGSRHTKWMKVMLPRLQMMRAMLKSTGVLAICIDDSEVFHLGMMLDEIFGEENRLAIINWQKTYSPKNDSIHVSSATEYVLVYAKNKEEAKTGLLDRTESMNAKYKNPDNDPEGLWRSDNPIARTAADRDRYAIQSPFTGALHYPGAGSWRFAKKDMKLHLEKWGSKYVEKDIHDGRTKALVIDKALVPQIPTDQNLDNNPVIEFGDEIPNQIKNSEKKAVKIRDSGPLPFLFFLREGYGRPSNKRYLNQVKAGKVPLTFWADEDYDELFQLDCQSWEHTESGHSQTGINELDYIVGKGHNFTTVKPIKLFEKIIQLWCPASGYVLDPYAGSGTTAHAVLELNHTTGADRKFILIEQGSPEKGDTYARTLTWERIKRAITGERVAQDGTVKVMEPPLGGGFTFQVLTGKVDSKVIMSMKRDEMVDLIVATHWDTGKKNNVGFERIDGKGYLYCVGKNIITDEGYFIVWENNGKNVGALDYTTYGKIVDEAKKANLKTPYHVYARYEFYQDKKNVVFYKIPDRILAHLGLNENSERFNEDAEGDN